MCKLGDFVGLHAGLTGSWLFMPAAASGNRSSLPQINRWHSSEPANFKGNQVLMHRVVYVATEPGGCQPMLHTSPRFGHAHSTYMSRMQQQAGQRGLANSWEGQRFHTIPDCRGHCNFPFLSPPGTNVWIHLQPVGPRWKDFQGNQLMSR